MVTLLTKPHKNDLSYLSRWESLGSFTEDPKKTRVLVVDFNVEVTPQLLKKYPNLKIVASPTTGHSHLKFDPKECGVELLTLRRHPDLKHARGVAEFTFKQILTLLRPNDCAGKTLCRKIMTIVGPGRIGRQVSALAGAFGIEVFHYDKGMPLDCLRDMVKKSDIISIHCEENQETKGLISREIINLIKKTAILINTARPSIVDNESLLTALKEKRLAGAAIDFDIGPYDKSLNILITNHIAGSTLEDRAFTDHLLVRMIQDRLRA